MADNSFIEKLRLNSIFPAEGQGLPSPLIGMPNFYSGRPPQQMLGTNRGDSGGLQRVSQQIANPKPRDPYAATFDINGRPMLDTNGKIQGGPPMGTAYDAPKSDEYGTQILMGNTEQDKLTKQKELLNTKATNTIATTGRGLDIKQQLADVAKFKAQNPALKTLTPKGGNVMLFDPLTGQLHDTGIDSGTLSEQDKIELTGDEARSTESNKQTGRMQLQGVKGNQNLEAIGARIAGQKDINANKTSTAAPKTYAADRNVDTRVKAQQLMTDRPDLASYLSVDANGKVNINQDTPLNELQMIQTALYPKGTQKDINLPSSTTKSSTATKPASKANDPLGIR